MNFESPNHNIGLPVFTIHGNHDDPSGPGNVSAVDILSEASFVNYFGKVVRHDRLSVCMALPHLGSRLSISIIKHPPTMQTLSPDARVRMFLDLDVFWSTLSSGP